MAEARYRLQPGDPDYGTVCPLCASPKHRQSRRCSSCYFDARRHGGYPLPPALSGSANPNWRGGVSLKQPTGAPTGRPQPQSHPWRRREAERLATAAARKAAA